MSLQRFYQLVILRSEQTEGPFEGCFDEQFSRLLEPPASLLTSSTGGAVQALFELVNVEDKKGRAKRFWREAALKKEEILKGDQVDLKRIKLDSATDPVKLELPEEGEAKNVGLTVGTMYPVRDFERMMAERNTDMTERATFEMCGVVTALLERGGDRGVGEKIVGCLTVLRRACVTDHESQIFNDFLARMKDVCVADAHKSGVWELVRQAQLTLIAEGEAPGATVSAAEAQRFMEDPNCAAAQSVTVTNSEVDEDLLDLLE